MTFLGITFLFALPLVTVPVVLHLLDRRRRVTVRWGAMEFLRAASIRRSRRRNLQQWLLLLARAAALAALIFALARPLVSARWWAAGEVTETVFVLDNSASMRRTVNGLSLFDSAVARVHEEVAELGGEDYVRVLTTSPGPEWLDSNAQRISTDNGRLRQKLSEGKATPGAGDLLSCLFAASQAEPPPSVVRRRVLIISDLQSADWQLTDQRSWLQLRDAFEDALVATTIEFVSATTEIADVENVAVTAVESASARIAAGEAVQVTATIESFSEQPLQNLAIDWSVDGETLATSEIELLEPGGTQQIDWTSELHEIGTRVVTCTLRVDDSLAIDNASSLVVEVAEGLPILVVENSPNYAEVQSDSWFIEASLGRTGEESEWSSVFQPTVIHAKNLADVPLGDFRAVVLPALTRLPAEAVNQLADFVRLGGGLWVALGPRTDVGAFNQSWFRETDGLVPLEIDRIVTTVEVDADHPTGINPLLDDHPATRQLADVQRLDLGDVEVSKRHRFKTNDHTAYSNLLEMVNGEPLAVETTYGRGRVIVQGLPLRLQLSRLVLSRSFVVMVQEWLTWLTEPAGTNYNLESGESLVLALEKDNPFGTDGILVDPEGVETSVESNASPLGPAYTLRPRTPGLYSLTPNGSNLPVACYVRRPTSESNLRSLDGTEREFLAETCSVSPEDAPAAAPLLGPAHRQPLWPFLLGTLLCLVVVELVMSVSMSLQRSGSQLLLRGRWTRSADVAPRERVA